MRYRDHYWFDYTIDIMAFGFLGIIPILISLVMRLAFFTGTAYALMIIAIIVYLQNKYDFVLSKGAEDIIYRALLVFICVFTIAHIFIRIKKALR